MYHIHHTLGVIIQTLPSGEANRVYFVFTENLGMVRVHAQGVRLSQSKLRSHLTPYSVKEFSLVRGKEIWRLTSVKDGPELCVISTPKHKKVAAKVLSILARLVHGEEAHTSLFIVVSEFLKELAVPLQRDIKFLEGIELITVLRILYELGYIQKTKELNVFLQDHTFTGELINEATTEKSRITLAINTALKESQL